MTDLLSASLVSQKWFIASKHPRFQKRITLSFANMKNGNIIPVSLVSGSTSRNYENLKLKFKKSYYPEVPFIEQPEMFIKHSKYDHSLLDAIFFEQIRFGYIEMLEKLKYKYSYEVMQKDLHNYSDDKIGIQHLKTLRVVLNHNSNGEIIKSITKIMKEEPLNNTDERLEEKKNCLTVLKHCRQTIKTLVITKEFWDVLLSSIKKDSGIIDGLDLKELHVDLGNADMEKMEFIVSHKNLTKLNFKTENLTLTQIQFICDNLDKLESLKICVNVIPNIECIKNLKNLKYLYLDAQLCTYDLENLGRAITSNRNETLQVLHLNCVIITKSFISIFWNLPNLRELKIIFQELQTDLFQLIFVFLVNLENLHIVWNTINLHYWPTVYRKEQTYNIESLTKIKHIKFDFPVEYIRGFSVDHLLKLKNLRSLSLYQGESYIFVTVHDQIDLMRRLPLLEFIEINGSSGIEPNEPNGPLLNKISKL